MKTGVNTVQEGAPCIPGVPPCSSSGRVSSDGTVGNTGGNSGAPSTQPRLGTGGSTRSLPSSILRKTTGACPDVRPTAVVSKRQSVIRGENHSQCPYAEKLVAMAYISCFNLQERIICNYHTI
eukprot:1196209-Prorocentrum_minimum.AAC.5